MIKLQVTIPGNILMEITAEDPKEVFRQVSFWGSLPHICPIDGYPTRLEHRNHDDNDYYEVVSTGPVPWRRKCGIRKDKDQSLFFRSEERAWGYWDAERKEQVTRVPDAGGAKEAEPRTAPPGAEPVLLTKDRAEAMHKEIGKFGVTKQYDFAAQIVGREVDSFTDLTEAEALKVYNAAKRRQASA